MCYKLASNKAIVCVIVTVAHDVFKKIKLAKLREHLNDKPVLIDVRQLFNG